MSKDSDVIYKDLSSSQSKVTLKMNWSKWNLYTCNTHIMQV